MESCRIKRNKALQFSLKILKNLIIDFKENRCDNVPEEKCKPVEREICEEVEMQQCRVEYKRQCRKKPLQKCRKVYHKECNSVYKGEKCRPGKPKKKCHTVTKEKIKYIKVKPVCIWPEKPKNSYC